MKTIKIIIIGLFLMGPMGVKSQVVKDTDFEGSHPDKKPEPDGFSVLKKTSKAQLSVILDTLVPIGLGYTILTLYQPTLPSYLPELNGTSVAAGLLVGMEYR